MSPSSLQAIPGEFMLFTGRLPTPRASVDEVALGDELRWGLTSKGSDTFVPSHTSEGNAMGMNLHPQTSILL